MRSVDPENLAEHSLLTAILAHGLALIGRDIFGKDYNPDKLASRAMFHDAAEIITGDMPTPIKYKTPALRQAYADVERDAHDSLLSMLPDEMRGGYSELFDGSCLSDKEKTLLRAADKLAAHIKCLEELSFGNREFSTAAKQTLEKLNAMQCPELEYFMENFLPSFTLTLDEQE
jgi:5'-deoxynucleotidase